MKKLLLISISLIFVTLSSAQCPTPSGLNVTSIMHNTAIANWNSVTGVDHYRIRKREVGTANWGNLLNIDSTMTSRLLPLLQPSTTYEWKIEAYCDSTNQINSNWSVIDTFTTSLFVAAQFNPIMSVTLSSLQCNTPTDLLLTVSQDVNEPDIATSTTTSDGGSFNIGSLSPNDSVGYANKTTTINTASHTISLSLKVGLITSQNSAIINAYDSTGSLVGFFTIENLSNGVQVTASSPNDGNNYTSTYTSNLHFTNIFVNPLTSGPLHFFADIQSELNDQFNDMDTVQIWCNTSISEGTEVVKLLKIVNILGEDSQERKNTLLFYIYDDGTVKKKIVVD
jgi:hypothetical protein|tara:strand:+ start:12663 stop:13679 length:1017 start_codon:yes stop_codon:yes gene_type:complete